MRKVVDSLTLVTFKIQQNRVLSCLVQTAFARKIGSDDP